ncbi:pirin family protein [Geomesophilobacter sediminis]|uniref:Pirin family protein n=1 Tax=Geomesophilobacter sediminis TaxID=2798584 RepID=A0A8J7M2F3_9BACT|nr:pirin family protein [Geomesophilobacter sediminis]MBJ6727504.1 pirin family protein [Geomesophilobacter sediminis]
MDSNNGTVRRIKKVWQSKPTVEGAGVHLRRVFGYYQVPELDPFLLLDDFHSSDPDEYLAGFPWHPHRGMETITYVLHGDVEHGDSMGNQGVIATGDVQWMTAGSGIIHQEMPKGDETGLMWGFQLWANLPASHKMMEPRYRGIMSEQIPEVRFATGVSVKVICGEVGGVKGPVRDIVTDPEYLDVTIPAETTFTHPIPRGHKAFAYVFQGHGYFDAGRDPFAYEEIGPRWLELNKDCRVRAQHLVLFDDGDRVQVTTENEPVRFLLVSGRPIEEPVAWYGPIVMNTQEELREAFEEYRAGTFIKHQRE